jgi:hypothetical protein
MMYPFTNAPLSSRLVMAEAKPPVLSALAHIATVKLPGFNAAE